MKNVLKERKGITLIAFVITIIDACIDEFNIEDKIIIYKKNKEDINIARSIIIRESMYEKLEDMRQKYGISITKLVNIAIKEGLDKYDNRLKS